MSVIITQIDSKIMVTINQARLEGGNSIFDNLIKEAPFSDTIKTLVIDFNRVEYINSLGMAELMSTYSNLRRINGRDIKLVFSRLQPQIAKVLRLLDLGEIAEIES